MILTLCQPPPIWKAHQKLDAAVDAAYGWRGRHSDAERVTLLFERYEVLIAAWNAEHGTAPAASDESA